jgi:hypothetical protein
VVDFEAKRRNPPWVDISEQSSVIPCAKPKVREAFPQPLSRLARIVRFHFVQSHTPVFFENFIVACGPLKKPAKTTRYKIPSYIPQLIYLNPENYLKEFRCNTSNIQR